MDKDTLGNSRLGPRQRELLDGWRQTVASTGSGVGYDFTAPSTRDVLEDALDTFEAEPSRENFKDVCGSLERASVMEGYVVGQWPESLEDLASLLREVEQAESWNVRWTENFRSDTWLFEVFTRTHDAYPVVDTQSQSYLRRFGIRVDDEFQSQLEGMESFRDRYEDVVGHVTEDTEYESSINREIDELFSLLYHFSRDDIPPRLLGRDKPVYEPLIGFSGTHHDGGRIELDIDLLEKVASTYSKGRNKGKYQAEADISESDRRDLWCVSHDEGWKHTAARDVSSKLSDEIGFTELEPSDIEDLLNIYDEGYGVVNGPIIEKLLGPQQGWRIWDDFKERTRENPEVAAAVLSRFFDPDADYITGRLDLFRWYYEDDDNLRTGALMKLATGLLMLARPSEYVMYQYSRCKAFFGDVCISGFEVDQGFNPAQYHRINAAATEIQKELDEHMNEDATMTDVQSIFYFCKDEPLESVA